MGENSLPDRMLKPLDGFRVLDFTNVPPGAACAVLLADLGAEVIRIDSPKNKGKPSLVVGQLALSRGRKSVTIDQRNPASVEVLLRLMKGADVVLENGFPGVMAERGYGYPQACEVNPGIVWCGLTGFGQDGPYARYSGHDISYLAHSGVLGALSADRSWHPGLPIALQAGALSAVAGIQSALIQKLRTGQGSFVDISLSEAATWFLTCGMNAISDRAFSLPESPDRRLYVCADGRYVAVACAEPRTWATLCAGLGCEDLVDQLHKWQDAPATIARLSELFLQKSAEEWVAQLAPLGAAVTILNHTTQLITDPHIHARGSVVEVGGTYVPANPLRLSSSNGEKTGTNRTPPAQTGANTDEILRVAGYSADEISALESQGIV